MAADAWALVLGSFPGRASLAASQYYGHPQNQFWRLLGAALGVTLQGQPYEQRLALLKVKGVGLWDVITTTEREGSLDSAIRGPVPNDLALLKRLAPGLRAVAHNGAESARSRRLTEALDVDVHTLPSTSPANAAWSFDRKLAAWRDVFSRYDLA